MHVLSCDAPRKTFLRVTSDLPMDPCRCYILKFTIYNLRHSTRIRGWQRPPNKELFAVEGCELFFVKDFLCSCHIFCAPVTREPENVFFTCPTVQEDVILSDLKCCSTDSSCRVASSLLFWRPTSQVAWPKFIYIFRALSWKTVVQSVVHVPVLVPTDCKDAPHMHPTLVWQKLWCVIFMHSLTGFASVFMLNVSTGSSRYLDLLQLVLCTLDEMVLIVSRSRHQTELYLT